MASPLEPHAALIYTMVLVSAADRELTDDELHVIGDIVNSTCRSSAAMTAVA